jgi:hypothetical protein
LGGGPGQRADADAFARDINAEIVRGVDRNSQRWEDLLDHKSKMLRATCQFVQGSKIYRELNSGGFSYRIYSFAKE